MQDPRDSQDNNSEELDDNNNDLAGNASGNIPDEYYDELNGKDAGSGTENDDLDDEDVEGAEEPLSDYEGLDDDDELLDDDE
jgi:hypothetical protein